MDALMQRTLLELDHPTQSGLKCTWVKGDLLRATLSHQRGRNHLKTAVDLVALQTFFGVLSAEFEFL
jgi:hypothetical protein